MSTSRRLPGRKGREPIGTPKRRHGYSYRRRRGMRRRAIWRCAYPLICATAAIGLNVYTAAANPIASGELTLTEPAVAGPYPITIIVPGVTIFDATLPDGGILDIEDTETELELTATAGLDIAGDVVLDGISYLFASVPYSTPIITLGGSTRGFDLPSFCVLAFACLGVWLFLQRRANRKRRPVVTEIIAKDRALLFLRPLSDSIAPIPGGRR